MPISGPPLRAAVRSSRGVICLGRESSPADASADDPDVICLGPLLALRDVELDLLPFLQAAVAAAGDRAEVHEHVLATIDRDEAVALVAVEPLHSALRHPDLLIVDAAPRPWPRGPRSRHLLLGQPVTERAGGCKPCGRPAAQRPETTSTRPRSQSGWSVQPVTLTDRAVQGSPGPDSDHRRS